MYGVLGIKPNWHQLYTLTMHLLWSKIEIAPKSPRAETASAEVACADLSRHRKGLRRIVSAPNRLSAE